MKTETETTLREAIVAASEALDPMHQGICWPDPIAWDGRPLEEQAGDLLTLMQARLRDDGDAGALERAYYALGDAVGRAQWDKAHAHVQAVYDTMHREDAD